MDRPCRRALRLDIDLPAAVRGPVDRWALRRFAAICFAVAIALSDLYLAFFAFVDVSALRRNSFMIERRPASLLSSIR